jgi:hypothetical protein
LGVFSKKYIAEGTILGQFPGYMMSSEDALTSKVILSLGCSVISVAFYYFCGYFSLLML